MIIKIVFQNYSQLKLQVNMEYEYVPSLFVI